MHLDFSVGICSIKTSPDCIINISTKSIEKTISDGHKLLQVMHGKHIFQLRIFFGCHKLTPFFEKSATNTKCCNVSLNFHQHSQLSCNIKWHLFIVRHGNKVWSKLTIPTFNFKNITLFLIHDKELTKEENLI